MTEVRATPVCRSCALNMVRDFRSELGVKNHGEYNHVSDALQVPSGNIDDHYRRFPRIQLDELNRPMFTSVRQHEEYANARGFEKC
jgi:hypothetical protein